MHIEKELQMRLNHLQPNKMNGNPLKENPNKIKQLDKPSDSRKRKNSSQVNRTENRKYLLRHRKQPSELRGSIIMKRKLIPTAMKAKQIKKKIGRASCRERVWR